MPKRPTINNYQQQLPHLYPACLPTPIISSSSSSFWVQENSLVFPSNGGHFHRRWCWSHRLRRDNHRHQHDDLNDGAQPMTMPPLRFIEVCFVVCPSIKGLGGGWGGWMCDCCRSGRVSQPLMGRKFPNINCMPNILSGCCIFNVIKRVHLCFVVVVFELLLHTSH